MSKQSSIIPTSNSKQLMNTATMVKTCSITLPKVLLIKIVLRIFMLASTAQFRMRSELKSHKSSWASLGKMQIRQKRLNSRPSRTPNSNLLIESNKCLLLLKLWLDLLKIISISQGRSQQGKTHVRRWSIPRTHLLRAKSRSSQARFSTKIARASRLPLIREWIKTPLQVSTGITICQVAAMQEHTCQPVLRTNITLWVSHPIPVAHAQPRAKIPNHCRLLNRNTLC